MSGTVTAGLIILIVLVVLLLAGVPIGISLSVASMAAIVSSLGYAEAVSAAALRMFRGISIFTLLAIPFFILAGNIMNKGGIAMRLINLAKALTGKIPGSLAHTNIVANMMFGAISGSGVAAASAMGSIVGPIEKQEGYDEDFSAAVNIATAPTGLLIPPSNVLITYALASGGTSVAALFLGGYIPGVLWGVSCMIVVYFYARKMGYVSNIKVSPSEFIKVLLDAVPSLLLIVIIVGGICTGIFTATEAAGIAVAYSLVLSLFIYRTIDLKELYVILVDSAKMSGTIMFLVGASNIMAWVMTFTGIPGAIASAILGVSDNKVVILLIINILLLFVGTFMDITPAILIFTPILLPICTQLGMTPLHFGIMMTFNLCIGCITPPAGRKLEDVMKPLLKCYIAIFVVLMMVTFIPALSSWLPAWAGY